MNKYIYTTVAFVVGLGIGATFLQKNQQYQPATVTVENLDGGYATGDDGNIYFYNHLVYAADPETFKVLDFDYAKDKDHVFYDGRVVNQVDPETFEVIGYIMGKDNRGVYTYDRRETNLQPELTEYLGNYHTYQKDRGVYYMNRFIKVSPEGFEILPYDSAATDGEQFYYRGRVVEEDFFEDDNKWEFTR